MMPAAVVQLVKFKNRTGQALPPAECRASIKASARPQPPPSRLSRASRPPRRQDERERSGHCVDAGRRRRLSQAGDLVWYLCW